MAEMSAKLIEDTRRMKSDLKNFFENKLANEEKHHRDNQRMLVRVRLDEAVLESDQLEREHKRNLVVLTEELTKALDFFRSALSQKVKCTSVDCCLTVQRQGVITAQHPYVWA